MCLFVFAIDCHPKYRGVFVHQREEDYDRPTLPAYAWANKHDAGQEGQSPFQILAGEDKLRPGGTWLGFDCFSGRIGALTNYRNPADMRYGNIHIKSRGFLIPEYLSQPSRSAPDYLAEVDKEGDEYTMFNILLGDTRQLWYYNNVEGRPDRGPRPVPTKQVHALCNHVLNTPWPRLTKAKDSLERLLKESDDFCAKDIFRFMDDKTPYADEQLPDTGVGIAVERILSPVNIQSKELNYGSRCCIVILVDHNDNVIFTELTRHHETQSEDIQEFRFKIAPGTELKKT